MVAAEPHFASSKAETSYRPAVRCANVTKTFGSGTAAVRALRGVDLEVRTGELMMLVGPSGSGKTTLISVIAGVLGRDGGDCSVFDRDYTRMSVDETTRFRGSNIGFVFQAWNLIPALTAVENAAVPLIINGANRRSAIGRASEMLGKVGFDDRMMNSFPLDLSGGQQQRIAIARSLIHNPRLIVCDEPTSALDSETGHKVMELMRHLAVGEGRALLVVTHDARIFEFADRIALMADGVITRVLNSPQEMETKS
ncbi:MAG TPA: ABC transporter ATP-binding protein [Candidatus Udaeobacter sp.]|jgi:putative ABC transport system ATP-binding protein|nr:ABC transporter ATP-binding protein [Candidatus Udaeobacter sp.]